MLPASSLLHGLGCGRRVKAKPADAGRFASLDTAATAKGGSYEEDGRGAGQGRPRPARDAGEMRVPSSDGHGELSHGY